MPRTSPSQWGGLFNFLGGGLVHFELFPEGVPSMCCEIITMEEDIFLWLDDDLIYIEVPA